MTFTVSISNENDPIVFQCDPTYDAGYELLKYGLQAMYLLPGAFLNFIIFFTIWTTEGYKNNSYFVISSMDNLVNFILILMELFFGRFFLYVTPLCPVLAPYFFEPLVFFKFIMILMNHLKACKSLIQILVVANRMDAVIRPTSYAPSWNGVIRFVLALIFLIPISIDWNLAISRVYMQPTFGGFYMEYIKKVPWASQSRFQLSFLSAAMVMTFVCTAVTILGLSTMKSRVDKLERRISVTTIIISMCFGVVTVFQILFVYYRELFTTSAVFGYSQLSWDLLTCLTPVIQFATNRKLRQDIMKKFGCCKTKGVAPARSITANNSDAIAAPAPAPKPPKQKKASQSHVPGRIEAEGVTCYPDANNLQPF